MLVFDYIFGGLVAALLPSPAEAARRSDRAPLSAHRAGRRLSILDRNPELNCAISANGANGDAMPERTSSPGVALATVPVAAYAQARPDRRAPCSCGRRPSLNWPDTFPTLFQAIPHAMQLPPDPAACLVLSPAIGAASDRRIACPVTLRSVAAHGHRRDRPPWRRRSRLSVSRGCESPPPRPLRGRQCAAPRSG